MNLTDNDIAEFQRLYDEKFDIKLDKQEAYQKLSALVRQMELVYRPITMKQQRDVENEKTKNI